MITNFGEDTLAKSLEILGQLRAHGINSEIFPESSKMKKQFEYADKKAIPFVLIIGSDEIQKEEFMLKNMLSGEQISLKIEQIIEKLNA